MIKIGDRVKFVSDTGVGIVLSVEKGIVTVEVDGFPRPTPISQVVAAPEEDERAVRQRIAPDMPQKKAVRNTPDSTQKNSFGRIAFEDDFEDEPIDVLALKRSFAAMQASQTPDQKAQQHVAPKSQYESTDFEMLLALVPVENDSNATQANVELYLVNDGSYDTYYSVAMIEKQGFVTTVAHGLLEAGCKTILETLSRRTLSTVKNLHIQIMPLKTINFVPQQSIDTQVELHPVKLSKENYFKENDFFDQNAYIIKLN